MDMADVGGTQKQDSASPYSLDLTQTLKACKVLQTHIAQRRRDLAAKTEKVDLLASGDAGPDADQPDDENDTPLWLIVSTKKHIADNKRLKPSKTVVPHPFNNSSASSICLITADPQRLFKDQIADPTFPPALSRRINRVIGLQKLKAKYKSYEARRQLLAEHDFFLADSRIVSYLPSVLGKVFFKGTGKRPISINISGPSTRTADGKKIKNVPGAVRKSTKNEIGQGAAQPPQIGREVQKALSSAIIHLSESASVSVKVARASFTPEQCLQNIEAVVHALTEKFIPHGWRNVRALHLKGPNTMSFPIWLASELWMDDKDVLDESKVQGKKGKKALPPTRTPKLLQPSSTASDQISPARTPKRKAHETSKPDATRHAKKKRKAEVGSTGTPDVAARKSMLKEQKSAAMAEVM